MGSFELIKVLSKLMPYYVNILCRHDERPDPLDMQQPDGDKQYHFQCKCSESLNLTHKAVKSPGVSACPASFKDGKNVARFSSPGQMRIKET